MCVMSGSAIRSPQQASLSTLPNDLWLEHLKEHVYVARALFPCDTIVAVAVPSKGVEMLSYFVVVFDATKWDDAAQVGAMRLREERQIFASIEPFDIRGPPLMVSYQVSARPHRLAEQ